MTFRESVETRDGNLLGIILHEPAGAAPYVVLSIVPRDGNDPASVVMSVADMADLRETLRKMGERTMPAFFRRRGRTGLVR